MLLLTIDIGGTAAKMALMDEKGVITERTEISTCVNNYEIPILQLVKEGAEKFLKKTGAKIDGIGVSAAGQIDTEQGIVAGTNGRIPHYQGSEVKKEMEALFGVPVWVLNDANAAALGECFVGRAKGKKNVLMVTLGTGVGGGIVLNGQIYGGALGIAGEIGHFTLYQDGLLCPCGKVGCYEMYASTSALVRKAEETTKEEGLNGRIIFERAGKGDEVMLSVLDAWMDDIAGGIGGLVHIFNPEMILIGGGVSTQEELLMKPLRRKVLEGVMPMFAKGLQIETAVLGNDAGCIGAGKFWLDQDEQDPDRG